MDIKIYPGSLKGRIDAISSKSDGHRNMIAAALAQNSETLISMNCISQDIIATAGCIEALGGKVRIEEQGITITPINVSRSNFPELDCLESGSTARFILPVAAALYDKFRMMGRGRLPLRPMSPLCKVMSEYGCSFSDDKMPFEVSGQITAGKYVLEGNLSSQYISGLLFALPLLSDNSEIILKTPLESGGYVDMTIATLKRFGIKIIENPEGYFIQGGQSYVSPQSIQVEGDWSNAAFWLCSGALGGPINIAGLDKASFQRDKNVLEILRQFGAEIEEKKAITATYRSLTATEIDATDIPDLIPVLAVVASVAKGTTLIKNAARLRLKESDRLFSVAKSLTDIGARVKEYPDSLEITGGELKGGLVDSFNDHRIVMAMAIAAQRCQESITIKNVEAVEKSYPNFFEDFQKLGGKINVL